MVHSTWGDWFVRDEVESADVDGISIWYLGCNGYIAPNTATRLYIDPYFGDGSPPRTDPDDPDSVDPEAATMCDAVLVTHEHIDHVHPPSYGPLVDDLGADVYAPDEVFENPPTTATSAYRRRTGTVVSASDDFSSATSMFMSAPRTTPTPGARELRRRTRSGTFFAPGDSRPADAFTDIADEFDIDLGVFAYGTFGNIYHTEDGETYPTDWYNDGEQVAEAVKRPRTRPLRPGPLGRVERGRGGPEGAP